jgi:serine/threonine-protein phosphatase 2A activator
VLEQIDGIARDTPPVDNSQSRFGNPAFKTFYDRTQDVRPLPVLCLCSTLTTSPQRTPELLGTIPGLAPEEIPVLAVYLQESWGNRTRIDYGSGMELNFLCFLYVLASDAPTNRRSTHSFQALSVQARFDPAIRL